MPEVNGKLVTCERCINTVFLKCTGEGEADGGYTRWNKFEPYPAGWRYCPDIGRLCPNCSAEYKVLLSNFISKRQIDKDGGL